MDRWKVNREIEQIKSQWKWEKDSQRGRKRTGVKRKVNFKSSGHSL